MFSPHSASPEYDRVMLIADDFGGLRCLPAGGAGVANEFVGGGIAEEEEGLVIFDWNRVCTGRIDPGTGILLVFMVLPIRGIRD